MRNEKSVNRLMVLLVCGMVLLTGLLMWISNHETISASLTKVAQPAYVEKIFNADEVLEIDIQISEENWNSMIENAISEQYVMADIVINGEVFESVGIRPKGNSSLSMVASDDSTDRFSFKVDFSEYVDGQSLYGLDKLALNNMIGDATYMKEYLSYDMFSAMGIATPGYCYANIKINGEPWGLYLALEVMEESFVQRYFGTISGSLYKPESDSMNMGNKEDKQEMMIGGNPFNENSQMMFGEKSSREGKTDEVTAQEERVTSDKMMPSGNGEMPEGMPSGNGEMPEGMPSGNGELLEGMTPPNGNEMRENNPMGGMSSSGSNLVYIDDEISSYSAIFENSVLKGTTEDAYHKVIEMMKNLNDGTNLEQYLDIEEILRYFAVNTFLVNLDSYAGSMKHNYYLYEQDGVFQILPWDFNLSFGAFNINDSSKVINFPIDEPVTDTMANSPLISKLLEVDEYKDMYHEYLQELIDGYIESGKYEATIKKLDELIDDYVANDATAFYSHDEYLASIPQLLVFGTDRTKSIKAQLAGEQPSDTYGNIETHLDLDALGSQNGAGGPKGMREFQSSTENESNQVDLNKPSIEDNNHLSQPNDSISTPNSTSSNQINTKPMNPGEGLIDSISEELKTVIASLDMTQIQQVVAQLSGKTEETLTEEDLNLLKELGIDEALIPMILELVENFSSFRMGGGNQLNTSSPSNESQQLIVAIGCLVFVLPALWFVSHYKKRKFRS